MDIRLKIAELVHGDLPTHLLGLSPEDIVVIGEAYVAAKEVYSHEVARGARHNDQSVENLADRFSHEPLGVVKFGAATSGRGRYE